MSAANVDPALHLRRRALRRTEGRRRLAVLAGAIATLLLPAGYWGLAHSSVFSVSHVTVTGATPRVDAQVQSLVAADVSGKSLLQVDASDARREARGAAGRPAGAGRPGVPHLRVRGVGRDGARGRLRPRGRRPLRGLGRRPGAATGDACPRTSAANRPAPRRRRGDRPHGELRVDAGRPDRAIFLCPAVSSAGSAPT